MKDPAHIRASVQRASESLASRPPGAKADPPVRAIWRGGLTVRLESAHPPVLQTDMPVALGGEEEAPSPGWYFRAGVASCLATTIALHAAVRGIALRRLEVEAHSESDPRGLLGCTQGVPAGAQRMWTEVRIEADDADAQQLNELVAYADAHAPMSGALRRAMPLHTSVHAGEGAAT
jgi:uncharacterized OsmC-like protein